MPGNFLDSNVLVCFAARDPDKADKAEALMREGGVISVQVLNEIASVARSRMKLNWAELHEALALVRTLLDVHPLTVEAHDRALLVAERYKLSIYDSMIVASALLADCNTLWSEDMQDGLVIERTLTVCNPFS